MAGDTDLKFHTPPGWPPMPDGFIPDDGWQPAPYWGVAPADWTFYSFNGQRVSPPAGKWRPGPGDIAQPFGADSFQASRPPDFIDSNPASARKSALIYTVDL